MTQHFLHSYAAHDLALQYTHPPLQRSGFRFTTTGIIPYNSHICLGEYEAIESMVIQSIEKVTYILENGNGKSLPLHSSFEYS